MLQNRMKINLSEYGSLEEKSSCFLQSDKYVNNCINEFDEFDKWFSYWEGVNERRKYKAYFRGMGEAKHKLFNSAQRLWLNYEMQDWKRQAPQLLYSDFIMKMIEEALGAKTLLANVFELYGIKDAHKGFPCLSILQHYGSPTPLLDWTYNFRVALFFATEYSTVPSLKIDNDLEDYFSIYVITEETYRVSEIEDRESVLSCFPDPGEPPRPGHLFMLTDIKRGNDGMYDSNDPFKKVLMATIYNQNIIPQEGLFIFNPHAEFPMEHLFNSELIGALPLNEESVPNSSFMVYNIHKRLGEYVKRKIAMQGFTKDYIMPDLRDYSKRIKEKVLNGLV
ncbi:MAG: FRG domain-containing protein [Ferruginibacter sp.]